MRSVSLQAALDHAWRDRLPPTPRERVDLAAVRVAALEEAAQQIGAFPEAAATLQNMLARALAEFDGARLAARCNYPNNFEDN